MKDWNYIALCEENLKSGTVMKGLGGTKQDTGTTNFKLKKLKFKM